MPFWRIARSEHVFSAAMWMNLYTFWIYKHSSYPFQYTQHSTLKQIAWHTFWMVCRHQTTHLKYECQRIKWSAYTFSGQSIHRVCTCKNKSSCFFIFIKLNRLQTDKNQLNKKAFSISVYPGQENYDKKKKKKAIEWPSPTQAKRIAFTIFDTIPAKL